MTPTAMASRARDKQPAAWPSVPALPTLPVFGREYRVRDARPPLAAYTDASGALREVVARKGIAGSVLVIDRDAATLGDRRLVAHLSPDEPRENAALLCRHYVADPSRGCCRAVGREDYRALPVLVEDSSETTSAGAEDADGQRLCDRHGRAYELRHVRASMSIPELRWHRAAPRGSRLEQGLLSLRAAVGALESYEPVCVLTRRALARLDDRQDVSTALLRAELMRLQDSPILLNRRLRETVLATVEHQDVSMSEIAIRCGRTKRDRYGNLSGETSWLARRIGLLPEGGRETPTPWIHSDVLALIARSGLGISPREVELS